ncbi:MAG: NAD(P)-dependent oxidoreductase [Bacteroidales bacterium]|jgi:nucleoside-diphosphate-sugar epimerase|nr:NAD(P)-dependent oxidoreductase [Bacteroidales bacterium]
MKKVLVTGASGFVGSHLADSLLEAGDYEVWAAVRATSSRKYLTDSRLKFIELSYRNANALKELMQTHDFDVVFHIAGATKQKRVGEFEEVNYGNTKSLVDALQGLRAKLIFTSSFAAHGAADPVTNEPARVSDECRPDTQYGKSKLKAEEYIKENFTSGNYIILRPTGVYGSRETDYFTYFQTIDNHLEPYLGFKPQRLTFVHGKDLADLCVRCGESSVRGRTYFVSDGNLYMDYEFAQITKEVLKTKTLKVKFPLFIVRGVVFLLDCVSRLTGQQFTLNKDKYNILKARNWACDTTDLQTDIGFSPRYDLKAGVIEAITWYKKEKWL